MLVGAPASGKSEIARALATAWQCDWIDTDAVVANETGESVGDYLRTHGEQAFRARELDALREALDSGGVVATGGGIVTTEQARALLSRERTYWLDCEFDVLVERLGDGDRPLLGDDPRATLERLIEQRTPWYRDVSRRRIDASGTLEEVVASVCDVFQLDDQ